MEDNNQESNKQSTTDIERPSQIDGQNSNDSNLSAETAGIIDNLQNPATISAAYGDNVKKTKKIPKGLIIAGAILILLVGFGLGSLIYKNQLNKDVAAQRLAASFIDNLTIAYDSDPDGLYPDAENSSTSGNFWSYYYEGLTSFNKDMEIQPQLAVSWESPDANTWRFHLRDDVKFHNGQAMTADDVVASINTAITNDQVNIFIPTVKSVKKIDNYTVDIITSSPTPILANLIPQIYILPKSVIETRDWTSLIGTGPYKIVSYEGSVFNLTRFNDYYGPEVKVKNVTIKGIADDEERLEALKKGEVDVATEITPIKEGEKTNDGKSIKFAVSKPIFVIYLGIDSVRDKSPYINNGGINPVKNLKVRQAISLAIDVPELIAGGDFNRYAEQATQLAPPTIFGYNPDIKPVEQNVEQAKALMKEAGFANGFNITMDTARPLNYQKILKEQLAEININLTIRVNNPSEVDYFGKLSKGDFSMVAMSWTIPSGDALEAYENVVGGGTNYLQINDSEINDLIEQARNSSDLSKRKELLKELALIVDEKKLVIPLLSQGAIFDYREGLIVTARADGMHFAFETSGEVPDSLKDYSFMDTVKKILHI